MKIQEYFKKLSFNKKKGFIEKIMKDLELKYGTVINMVYGTKPVAKKNCEYIQKLTNKKVKIKDMRKDY